MFLKCILELLGVSNKNLEILFQKLFHPIIVGDIWAAVSSAVCSAGKSLLLLCWGASIQNFGMVCVSEFRLT